MASDLYYLSKTDGTSKIYFNVNPTPLPDEEPVMKVINKELMPGLSGSTPVDGGRLSYIVGTNVNRSDLPITIKHATQATVDGIRTLFDLGVNLYYSPDDGTTIWQVCFADGKSFQPKRYEGSADLYSIQMAFNLVSKVAP